MAVLAPPSRPAATTAASTPILSKTAPRPSAISRRSTLKRSIDDANLTQVPSSPTKRLRVQFDADVDIVSADDEDDLDPLLVNEQVRRAIERHLNYDNESYERIRSLFTIDPEKERAPSSKLLRLHLQALEANVTRLRKDCGSLVLSVVSSEWVGRDEKYVATFVRFLGSLVVTQGGYVNSIMSMLVDLLGPQETKQIPGCKAVPQFRIHQRASETLRNLTSLSPLASSVLAQRIAAKLDFDFQRRRDRMTFIRSFMDLIHYTPEMTSEILNSVLQQLTRLDADIQASLEDEDEDDEDGDILQHMTEQQIEQYRSRHRRRPSQSSSDDSSTALADDSDSEDEEEQDTTSIRRRKLQSGVRQVDQIMDILFDYFDDIMSNMSLQAQDGAIEQLIAQFNQFILPTQRSRHPQFLIFRFAQTSKARVDRFITNCLTRLLDQRYPPLIRHQAAAYFSGFVGRAKEVSPTLVAECLDLLCMELDKIRLRYEPSCMQPDLQRYSDFYVMFQAVIYILCTRWRDLHPAVLDALENGEEHPDMTDEELRTDYHLPRPIHDAIFAATYSKLNPLRIATHGIVEMFAQLTYGLQVMYVYPKLEENKRVRVTSHWRSISDLDLNTTERDLGFMGDNGRLEAYFPFDPYHLPISRSWVASGYLSFRPGPWDTSEDGQDESDSEDQLGSDDDDDNDNNEGFDLLDDDDASDESDED